jgi:hypothetical protein
MLLAQEMPARALSRLVGEHEAHIWRVVGCWVGRSRSQLDLSSLAEVGVDETPSAKGHNT